MTTDEQPGSAPPSAGGRVEPLPPGHPYRDAPVGVATRHRKTPLLEAALGGRGGLVLRTVPVDTDRFGTFTGERARPGSAEQVVLAKAAAGAREGGLGLGAASEGSFGPDPVLPLLVVQHELVALVDVATGVGVVGRASAAAPWALGSEVASDEPVRQAVARLRARLGSGAPRRRSWCGQTCCRPSAPPPSTSA